MAIASMMTKRKMLARPTIASAMPARLIGLRNSMRERCQGSTRGGGVFSVSIFHPCGCGLFFGHGWLIGGLSARCGHACAVESVLIAVVVQSHFSVPPCPVHRIYVRVEEHLVEVPNDDGEGREHRFVEVNGGCDIEPPARHVVAHHDF